MYEFQSLSLSKLFLTMMLDILSGSQVRLLDAASISAENIESWQLMERAAGTFAKWLADSFPDFDRPVVIYCGPGNNGGDGLAIARLIANQYRKISVVFFEEPEKCSRDYQINWRRLPDSIGKLSWESVVIDGILDPIVIDSIFGVGINRPIEGKYLQAVTRINQIKGARISVDIPSGLPSDDCLIGEAVKADFTVSFQFPKASLLFPEHASFVGQLVLQDIGIRDEIISSYSEGRFFVQSKDIPSLHKRFHQFSHKGDFGRVLLIGGQVGKIGSMVLASKAALRTGSGLVFVSVPESESQIIQVSVPEAMVSLKDKLEDLSQFDAVGIGPGWGLDIDPDYFEKILRSISAPIVIDADGLNLLAKYSRLLEYLTPGSILTPHLKEFERLVGPAICHKDRLAKAKEFAARHSVYLVLKGAFTAISCPDGNVYFNSSGNKFMATAGSGDVLTGMLTSLLGQGYHPRNAAICGVFHHGMAGDMVAKQQNRGLIASDIVEAIPKTFVELNIP